MAAVSSAARLLANRRNAQKSTGPRTIEGKIRARANAVKHGLTGAGLALPIEDAAEVERRFLDIQGELVPQTVLGTYLAHQMALMTVRTQRAARQQTAALARHTRAAGIAFDHQRQRRAQALYLRLLTDPVTIYPLLLAQPEGVDRLISGLLGLERDLRADIVAWTSTSQDRLAALHGRRPGDDPTALSDLLARGVEGDFAGLDPAETAHLDDPSARQFWAADQLADLIAVEVARLRAHHATLDHEAIALARLEAEDEALFDASKDATLARKYEAESRRELYRACREFAAIEALGGSPTTEDSDPEPDDELNFAIELAPDNADPAAADPAALADQVASAAPTPAAVVESPEPTPEVAGSGVRKPLPRRRLGVALGSFLPAAEPGDLVSAHGPRARADRPPDAPRSGHFGP